MSCLPSKITTSLAFLAMMLAAPPALASADRTRTDPASIDLAVAAFTGARIGEPGGARNAADPRLSLARCNSDLRTSWHGARRAAVRVECEGPEPWRIFVATLPSTSASMQSPARPAMGSFEKNRVAVKRGDPVTVIVRGSGFIVQQAGEALENGTVGDWIGIRTTRRGEPIRARIERPGLAVIPVG